MIVTTFILNSLRPSFKCHLTYILYWRENEKIEETRFLKYATMLRTSHTSTATMLFSLDFQWDDFYFSKLTSSQNGWSSSFSVEFQISFYFKNSVHLSVPCCVYYTCSFRAMAHGWTPSVVPHPWRKKKYRLVHQYSFDLNMFNTGNPLKTSHNVTNRNNVTACRPGVK